MLWAWRVRRWSDRWIRPKQPERAGIIGVILARRLHPLGRHSGREADFRGSLRQTTSAI